MDVYAIAIVVNKEIVRHVHVKIVPVKIATVKLNLKC